MMAKFGGVRSAAVKQSLLTGTNILEKAKSFSFFDDWNSVTLKTPVHCAPYCSIPLHQTSSKLLSLWQRLFIFVCIAAVAAALMAAPTLTAQILIGTLSFAYLADLLFCFFLIARALIKTSEINIPEVSLDQINRTGLPIYTILCPLFKEGKVLLQFIRAMTMLRYPRDKLQILLLLEANDEQMITVVQKLGLPACFQVVVVPPGNPQTKPRACNVGLQYAKGEYTVVFDAEDIPERNQLLKAVAAFRQLPPEAVCMQAKLDFYNRTHNIITRLFTAEYSLLFNLTLIGLQSINGPIPLGGTSNHFRTAALRQVGGWDPFNVTEDCDLGIRLFTRGYRTAIINSVTYEEATSRIPNWLRQRSRWIKGYLQTLIVHSRTPQRFMHSLRTIPHFATFLLVVGAKTASMMINPFLGLMTLGYFLGPDAFRDFVQSLYLTSIFYVAFITWILGNFLYVLYYLIGLVNRGHPELVKLFPFIPFYWLLMSLAGWKAIWQLMHRPHFWEKTTHGFHLDVTPVRQREKVPLAAPQASRP